MEYDRFRNAVRQAYSGRITPYLMTKTGLSLANRMASPQKTPTAHTVGVAETQNTTLNQSTRYYL